MSNRWRWRSIDVVTMATFHLFFYVLHSVKIKRSRVCLYKRFKMAAGIPYGEEFRKIRKFVSKSEVECGLWPTQSLLLICQCYRDRASDPVWHHAINFADVVSKHFINVKSFWQHGMTIIWVEFCKNWTKAFREV